MAQSTKVFDPNVLVKNAYQFKNQSGILDTNRTYMRFDKMLDEHTAMFEVRGYGTNGQLAVMVQDSVAPDPYRQWRVTVLGPMHGTNVYGAEVTVTAIRFDGYYVPPPPTQEELGQQEAARKAQQERQAAIAKAMAEAKAKRQEQVDHEVARREAAKLAQRKRAWQSHCDSLIKAEADSNALNARIAAKNPEWAEAQAKNRAVTADTPVYSKLLVAMTR